MLFRSSTALGEANPGVIDVGSLENRSKSVDFFLKEMSRRIQSRIQTRGQTDDTKAPPRHVVVILSGPMEFASGTEMRQIQLEENPGVELYYLRFHALPRPHQATMAPSTRSRGFGGGRGMGFPPSQDPRMRRPQMPDEDSLADTLKPLAPHLFDIRTPDDLRRALAAMLEEIARR